jgi:hypothetical protein
VRGVENSSTGAGLPAGADPLIERFWKVLEEQTENVLRQHADEVEALTQALLEKSDLSHDEVMALLGDNGWRPDKQKMLRLQREPARLPPAPRRLPAPADAVEDPLADTQPTQPVPRVDVRSQAAGAASTGPARMAPPPRPADVAESKAATNDLAEVKPEATASTAKPAEATPTSAETPSPEKDRAGNP